MSGMRRIEAVSDIGGIYHGKDSHMHTSNSLSESATGSEAYSVLMLTGAPQPRDLGVCPELAIGVELLVR